MGGHVAELCAAHGITAKELECSSRGAHAGRRRIFIERPDTPARYFVALHEIAHVVVPAARGGRQVERELIPWRWALEHARCTLTSGVRRAIAEGLGSHVERAFLRRGFGLRRAVPGPDHAVWGFLDRMDPGLAEAYDGRGYGQVFAIEKRQWALVRQFAAIAAAFVLGSFSSTAGAAMSSLRLHLWTHIPYRGMLWNHWAWMVYGADGLALGTFLWIIVRGAILGVRFVRTRPRTLLNP
jgi:hypothetical protein